MRFIYCKNGIYGFISEIVSLPFLLGLLPWLISWQYTLSVQIKERSRGTLIYVLQREEHLCMSNVDRIKVYDLVDLIKNNRNNITLEVRGELRNERRTQKWEENSGF